MRDAWTTHNFGTLSVLIAAKITILARSANILQLRSLDRNCDLKRSLQNYDQVFAISLLFRKIFFVDRNFSTKSVLIAECNAIAINMFETHMCAPAHIYFNEVAKFRSSFCNFTLAQQKFLSGSKFWHKVPIYCNEVAKIMFRFAC